MRISFHWGFGRGPWIVYVEQADKHNSQRLPCLFKTAHKAPVVKPQAVIPKMSQETLAGIIGTTRSRVSFFMNRFRKLGFIEYNGGLTIHSSLLNVVLHD